MIPAAIAIYWQKFGLNVRAVASFEFLLEKVDYSN